MHCCRAPAIGNTKCFAADALSGKHVVRSSDSSRVPIARCLDVGGPLELFFDHLLEHVPIERQIGHHALKPRVLLAQHTKLS